MDKKIYVLKVLIDAVRYLCFTLSNKLTEEQLDKVINMLLDVSKFITESIEQNKEE